MVAGVVTTIKKKRWKRFSNSLHYYFSPDGEKFWIVAAQTTTHP